MNVRTRPKAPTRITRGCVTLRVERWFFNQNWKALVTQTTMACFQSSDTNKMSTLCVESTQPGILIWWYASVRYTALHQSFNEFPSYNDFFQSRKAHVSQYASCFIKTVRWFVGQAADADVLLKALYYIRNGFFSVLIFWVFIITKSLISYTSHQSQSGVTSILKQFSRFQLLLLQRVPLATQIKCKLTNAEMANDAVWQVCYFLSILAHISMFVVDVAIFTVNVNSDVANGDPSSHDHIVHVVYPWTVGSIVSYGPSNWSIRIAGNDVPSCFHHEDW